MAGTFHYLRFRTFQHATEEPSRVLAAMRHAAQSPKLEPQADELEGTHGNPIVALEADVRANPTIRTVFMQLARDDPEGLQRLQEEAEARLDEHYNFYFRLDKQEAYLGRSVLTYGDDAVMVRARIDSFLAKRNGALDELLSFLRGIANA